MLKQHLRYILQIRRCSLPTRSNSNLFTYVVAGTGAIDNTAALLSVTSTTASALGDVSILPVPTLSGNSDDLSAPVTFYVEPGLIPTLELSNVLLTNGNAIVCISGYLVALNQ